MCLTHDSNPRAACGLKGPFRLVKVVYTHTNKQRGPDPAYKTEVQQI